jgi:hypothetical protein
VLASRGAADLPAPGAPPRPSLPGETAYRSHDLRRITQAVQDLTGAARPAATRVIETARALVSRIDALDREVA